MDEHKKKALNAALSQIERQFGKEAVRLMGDGSPVPNIQAISTGSLGLDIALGIGGLPRGRVVEIFGPESSGKSTLAMHVVDEAQRNGGVCAYGDAEHAMDPVYARAIGVNVDDLLISQPDTGEQALEITDMLIRSGAIDIVVIDLVAALTPRAELEGDMGDTHVGLQARLMSQALRKLTGTLSKSDTIAIFINQLREKIGVMFGSPETTPGGRALKFYSSIRLDIRRIEAIKDGTDVVGNRTRVKVVKNKCSAPFKQAEFDIMYGKGISREGSLLDVAVDLGFVKKSGAWFTYEGEQLGQGRENVKTFLIENPQLMAEIDDRVRECLAPKEEDLVADGVLDPDDVPISIDSSPPPASHGVERSGPAFASLEAAPGALRVRTTMVRCRPAPGSNGPTGSSTASSPPFRSATCPPSSRCGWRTTSSWTVSPTPGVRPSTSRSSPTGNFPVTASPRRWSVPRSSDAACPSATSCSPCTSAAASSWRACHRRRASSTWVGPIRGCPTGRWCTWATPTRSNAWWSSISRSANATPFTRVGRRASRCSRSSDRWSSPSTPLSTSRATRTVRSTWSTAASPLSMSARLREIPWRARRSGCWRRAAGSVSTRRTGRRGVCART